MRTLWPLLALLGADVLAAADPFYLARLRDGEVALARADARGAAKELRLACFGLMDEPDQLGRCLTNLALAEARSGETEALERTFERLVEAESLVGAWRLADLEPATRTTFAVEIGRALPEPLLEDSAIFGDLLAVRRRAELAGLSARALEKALRERIERQPGVAFWSVELARFELNDRRPAEAVAILDALLARGTSSPEIVCLRGRAVFALGRWQEAAAALLGCQGDDASLDRVEALMEGGHEGEARQLFESLVPEVRGLDRGVALAARLPPVTAPVTAPATAPANVPVSAPASAPVTVATDSTAATLAAAMAQLAELRLQLSAAADSATVEDVVSAAEALAKAEDGPKEAWHLAAEGAYRLSQWPRTVTLFGQGGPTTTPEQGFYLAVALFETGEVEQSRRTLEAVLPRLRRTPYVETMVGRIRGED